MNYAGVQVLRIGKYGDDWFLSPSSLVLFCDDTKWLPVAWYGDEDSKKAREVIGIANKFRMDGKNMVCDMEIIKREHAGIVGKDVYARCSIEVLALEGKGKRRRVNKFGLRSLGLSERPGPVKKLRSIWMDEEEVIRDGGK